MAGVIELGWVRGATAGHYSHTGKPSIDPVVIAKMMILGFLYNIPSERQLMREIQVNLAYRWYLGYDLDEAIPNHSVLSKARRRFGRDFFERLFASVLEHCRNNGLIDGSNVLIDSTLVKGNASQDSITALRYSPAEYFEQLDGNCPASDADEVLLSDGHQLGSKRVGKNRIMDQKHSRTDSDATLTRKGKTTVLGYKTHICADSHKGVITAVTVSTAAADDTSAVPELLDKHEQLLDAKPLRAVADGEYGSQDCLAYIQNNGIETVIKKRGGGNKHGGYDKSCFTYDPAKDVFICPAGEQLRRIRTDAKEGKAGYQCSADICGCCVRREECLGEKSTAKARNVTRFDTQYETCAQAACDSGVSRKLLKLRHTLLEGLFGQAKNYYGLGRARWRGLGNMLIQSLLTAAVLNLKKPMTHVFRTAAITAQTACITLVIDAFLQIYSLHSLKSRPDRILKMCCEI